MINFTDTGLCIPETAATLAVQQGLLIAGKRNVQMFPTGTDELPMPQGFGRHQNARGVFHFRPDVISGDVIETLSAEGRENEFLHLGPIGKPEVAKRLLAGESLLCVTEYEPDGTEVRSAAGTDKTIDEQCGYFERTKQPGNAILICNLADVVRARLTEMT